MCIDYNMRNLRQTRQIMALPVVLAAIIATLLATTSVSLASGSAEKYTLRLTAPAIDMIITGSRIPTIELGNLPYGAGAKDECLLCFHRDLMKRNSENNIKKAFQPFPAD
jgi:hypothetical protein